jgi:hypothetical protein
MSMKMGNVSWKKLFLASGIIFALTAFYQTRDVGVIWLVIVLFAWVGILSYMRKKWRECGPIRIKEPLGFIPLVVGLGWIAYMFLTSYKIINAPQAHMVYVTLSTWFATRIIPFIRAYLDSRSSNAM